MNKEFIPYKLALELKQLGFDEPCFGYYYTLNGKDWKFADDKQYDSLDEFYNIGSMFTISAPLYQQAFRFFHNKYRLHIGFSKRISRNNEDYWASDIHFIDTHIPQHTVFADTYEDAELACLEKLIEIVKENK
jgi:hypothetical protein